MAQRRASYLSMQLIVAILISTIGTFVPYRPALAQDAALIAKLVDLTQRKGTGDPTPPDCEKVLIHAFNVYKNPSTQSIVIILFNKAENHDELFAAGLNGDLQIAKNSDRNLVDGKFYRSTMAAADARNKYKKEFAFWRSMLSKIESQPDRKN